MIDTNQKHFISFRDRVTGPFTIVEIRHQLRSRQINSLYKVQVNREWILLRELLGQLKREEEKLAAEKAEQLALERSAQASFDQSRASHAHIPKVVLEEANSHNDEEDSFYEATQSIEYDDEDEANSSNRGLGIASFVLSLFFFIPFLNLICMILSIILGHLALPRRSPSSRLGQPALPWTGVWTSYIYAGVLMLYTIAALTNGGILRSSQQTLEFFTVISLLMLVLGLSACVGAGLLMLAVNMMESYIPKFHVGYVAVLLPSSIGLVINTFLNSLGPFTSSQLLANRVGVIIIIMLIQMLVWSWMIRDTKGKPLGYARAATASLFYTIIFSLIGFIIFLIMRSISN
jgi:hypothetical protein